MENLACEIGKFSQKIKYYETTKYNVVDKNL